MSNAYRWQHYLPVVYLKEFAVDGGLSGRAAHLWRFDGQRNHLVSAESQCAEQFFYTKTRAKEVEEMFGQMESFYSSSIKTIKQKQFLPPADLTGLILAMGDMHSRNVAYVNKTGRDNFYAYQLQSHAFISTLARIPRSDTNFDQFARYLVAHWSARLVRCDADTTPLITSDNPVVCLASGERKAHLSLLTMPLAPDCLAIAYDNRIHRVKREFLDKEDVGELWHLQCRNAIRSVYSWKQIEVRHEESVRGIFAENPKRHRGVTTRESVQIPMFKFPKGGTLSFIAPSASIL